MAAEESRVSIVAWPEGQSAQLRHAFDPEQPCSVTVAFAPTPAQVVVSSTPQQPVHVQMNMQLSARQPLPVCISVCEPICARSDYRIGISIFNNPFATIDLRGTTRLSQCDDNGPPPAAEACVDFQAVKTGQHFEQPIVIGGVTFAPIGDPLRSVSFGDPPGTVKLGFPPKGMRITFPGPVRDVRLTINNYAGHTIEVAAFAGGTLLSRTSETIENTVRDVTIPQAGITSVELSGGANESGLVRVCATAEAPASDAVR